MPEVCIPDTASYLQYRLGAREIPAYDLGRGGCCGFLQGVDIASSRVRVSGGNVLVVGVQLVLRMIDWTDRNTCVLFGDAAGAALIGPGAAGGEILEVVSGTDGTYADAISMPVGGTRTPVTPERVRQNLHRQIAFDGRAVFKEAVRRMSEASRDVLARAQLTLQDVTLVIPHQANLRIIEAVAKNLHLPMDKFFVNIQEYANTGPASLPLALCEAQEQGRVAPGDLILLTVFGAGFHWAAALIRF